MNSCERKLNSLCFSYEKKLVSVGVKTLPLKAMLPYFDPLWEIKDNSINA